MGNLFFKLTHTMCTGKGTNHSVPPDDTGHTKYPHVTSTQTETQDIISNPERLGGGEAFKRFLLSQSFERSRSEAKPRNLHF